jgi:hypothetical protein
MFSPRLYIQELWATIQPHWWRMVCSTHAIFVIHSWYINDRYAVERNTNHIKIWFWPRNSDGVPSDIASGSSSINLKDWVKHKKKTPNVAYCSDHDLTQGKPTAHFPDTFCDIDHRFQEHNIIINLTFCERSVTYADDLPVLK